MVYSRVMKDLFILNHKKVVLLRRLSLETGFALI